MKMPDDKKEGSIWGRLILGILMALFVGGTTPWWWDKVFAGNQPSPTPLQTVNSSSFAKPQPLQEKYEFKDDDGTHTFVHTSDKVWKEKDTFDKEYNAFKEIERDSDYITIYDASREMKIKIPIEGGNVLVTWKQNKWVDFPYRYVTKKSNT